MLSAIADENIVGTEKALSYNFVLHPGDFPASVAPSPRLTL